MTSGLVNPGFSFTKVVRRVLPEPVTVSRSLPQGDAWSLIAMVAVLTPATWQILHENSSVTFRSFIDDRSWSAESA